MHVGWWFVGLVFWIVVCVCFCYLIGYDYLGWVLNYDLVSLVCLMCLYYSDAMFVLGCACAVGLCFRCGLVCRCFVCVYYRLVVVDYLVLLFALRFCGEMLCFLLLFDFVICILCVFGVCSTTVDLPLVACCDWLLYFHVGDVWLPYVLLLALCFEDVVAFGCLWCCAMVVFVCGQIWFFVLGFNCFVWYCWFVTLRLLYI